MSDLDLEAIKARTRDIATDVWLCQQNARLRQEQGFPDEAKSFREIGAFKAQVVAERDALVAEVEQLRVLLDSWGGDAEGSEPCQRCDRYNGILWHAPQSLWQELNGRYGGLMCPRCFDALAKERGIWLTWTPVVGRRDGVMTTNWWGDPIRDRLLMGEPDPHFHDDEKAQVPQGHWGEIAVALGWSYETPYPDENRSDRMPGVVYRDAGVNTEAEEYAAEEPS